METKQHTSEKPKITEEIKICIEMNENVNTTFQNIWGSGKAVLSGKSEEYKPTSRNRRENKQIT